MQPNEVTTLITRFIKVPTAARRGQTVDQDYRTLREMRLLGGTPTLPLEDLPKGLSPEQFADTPIGLLAGRITRKQAVNWRVNYDTSRKGNQYKEQGWIHVPTDDALNGGPESYNLLRFAPLGEDNLVHTRVIGRADYRDNDEPIYTIYTDDESRRVTATAFGDIDDPKGVEGYLHERYQRYLALSLQEGNRKVSKEC